MSRTSEYTLDLVIKDDQARETLDEIEEGFKAIGKEAKESLKSDDIDSQLKAIATKSNAMIAKMQDMAVSSPVDFDTYFKTFSGGAKKAIKVLETQYASLIPTLKEVEDLEDKRSALEAEKKKATTLREQCRLEREIQAINEQLDVPNRKNIRSLIQQNRQIRANLETAKRSSQADLIAIKKKEALEKQAQLRDRVNEIRAKKKHLFDQTELKAAHQKLAEQEKLVKAIKQAEKSNLANVKAIQAQAKAMQTVNIKATALQKVLGIGGLVEKAVNSGIQNAYNISGMVGGAARTAIGAGKAAFGMVSGAISGVSAVADREVEKERLANRVKGFNLDDAKDMMGQLYIQTGADYAVIVEAINRVQNVLKSNDKGELVAATATEIRYPGAAQTFASANTQADAANFARYGNRLKAVQNATGASDEQVQAASELINNLKPESFKNASLTDLQTVYLGLQNSGAFDSQDELDKAFKKFVADQSKSGQNAFEFAQNYDWNKTITGERNRIQASNTLAKIDWGTMGSALNKTDEQTSQGQSSAETMAMKMRQMEEKKNELMLKLVPAVLPIVEKLSDLISGPTGSQIIDGFVNLFKAVIPALDPIFKLLEPVLKVMSRVMNWLGDVIIPKLLSVLQSIADWFGSDDSDEYAMPQNAAGGLAFMPSIVGERGPEAIIPLDYSRVQRAENIANTVNQTFNMGNSQTTALSLAQAVRSRDFTRAMTDNQFFTRRCGAF